MNLELTEEQLALRSTVRRFLAERAGVAAHVRPLLDDPSGSTTQVWRGLADLGTTGLLVPEEFGGAGMGMVEAGIVLEELGAVVNPGPWLSTAVAAVRALVRSGGEGDEAAMLLTKIADGSVVAAVGPLDPAAERPVPRRGPGDAAAADLVLVLVRDGGRSGLYAVDADGDGISSVSRGGIDPTRKQFRCTFTDAPARRLATVTPRAAQALLDDVLVAMAADALGAARAALELAVGHAKVREQFGHPIGSFQAVQHLCADMLETAELARSGVLHGLWAADDADPDERHLAAVRAKAFAGRLTSVGDTAVQVVAGLGFTWEHDLHLYLKRLLSWSSYLGAPDRYLLELGSRLVRPVTWAETGDVSSGP